MATKLSANVSAPQPTEPGDAPADTTDPKEQAIAVAPNKVAAATAGHRTVNTVIPGTPYPDNAPVSTGRTETYTAYDNTGKAVPLTRDIDTGIVTAPSGGGGKG